MILYTNGCSWTWGGSLGQHFKTHEGAIDHKKRLEIVWPHHLGKLMSADKVINIAEGCGSNQRIVRTTYDWLKEQSPEDLNETIAVIQFTDAARLEIYSPCLTGKYENLPGQWVKGKWDVVNQDSIHKGYWDRDAMLQKVQKRISETHAIEDVYRNIGYLYALEGMFQLFGVKNWYCWHLNHEQGWVRNFTAENVEVFGSHINILDKAEKWTYNRVSVNDTHPGIQGHRDLAEIIYNKIAVKT